jgi:hypothetical protein
VSELDLVHEGEHERNTPAAFREPVSPKRLYEAAPVGHANLEETLVPLQDDLDRVRVVRLPDRVAERLSRRQLEVEALFGS